MPDRLPRTLAARLRDERQRRGLSLRKLAAASRLSTTTVHQIERGRGSPSLATLQALASTLGVALGALFEGQGSRAVPAVWLAARDRPRARIPRGWLERLAGGLPGQRIRGLVVTLAPGGATGEQPMTHRGHELVLGLSGRCVYEVAGQQHRIGPGDSLVVDSRQPHRAMNPTRRTARILLVLYAAERAIPRRPAPPRRSR